MKIKHCNWCDHQFEPKVNYQIYCSSECRESATKQKIAERYAMLRRTNKKHIDRKCVSCGNKLSVYNDEKTCQACTVNPSDVTKALKEIKGMGNGKNI